MNLGENIKRLREEKGISQEYAAQKIGVSVQSVSLWEENKTVPSIENLVMLSEILGVTVDEVLGKGASQPADNSSQSVQELPIGTAAVSKDDESKKQGVKLYYRKNILSRCVIAAIGLIYLFNSCMFMIFDRSRINPIFLFAPFIFIALGLMVPLVLSLYKRQKSFKFIKDSNGIEKLYFYRQGIGFSTERQDEYDGNFFTYYNEINGVYISKQQLVISYAQNLYTVNMDDIQGDKDVILKMLINNIRYFYSQDVAYKYPLCSMSVKNITLFQRINWTLFCLMIISANVFVITFMFFADGYKGLQSLKIASGAFIIFSLASLATAIFGKSKGLKTVGYIVVSGILTFYAAIGFLSTMAFSGNYVQTDYSRMQEIETVTGIDFPDGGEAFIKSSSKDTLYSYSGIDIDSFMHYLLIKKDSLYVDFTDEQGIAEFEKYLVESGEWKTQTSDLPQYLSYFFEEPNQYDYDYYAVFNATDGEINKTITEAGNYELMFLKYNQNDNRFVIIEYDLTLTD